MTVEENKNSVLADVIRPGVSRGLDFVTLEELRKRTGVNPDDILKFAMSEMLCNALDKDATQINIDVQDDAGFDRLTVSDNGTKKLSHSEIDLILDFENKASSKRGFLRVSRGYLGNALKCIFGYSYALAESKGLFPPPITITGGSCQNTISLKPDRIRAVIDAEIVQTDGQDDGYTSFTVKFPKEEREQRLKLRDIVFATSMVNPTRKISFNLYGEQGTLGTAEESKAIQRETSVAWYTLKQFTELFEDFLRASPDTQLKEFISMFKGFTSRKIIREILQEINTGNQDLQPSRSVQFFPTSTLKDLPIQTIKKLFAIMKAKAKSIKKRSIPVVLGFVGEDTFSKVQHENGWERLRYIILEDNTSECPDWLNHAYVGKECRNLDHVEYPYLIELAVFDRRKEDQNGLRVYSCVNFMMSAEPMFARNFNVSYRLGRVGIRNETPVTVVVHLVCPVLNWLNYGKNALDVVDTGRLMEKAFDKVLPIPKTPREYHPPPPPRPLSWVPHGKVGDQAYEERLKSFAAEIKTIEYQRTSSVKYSTRGWCYQLEGLGKIDKGEFGACQKAINDSRKLGYLPIDFVAEDQDQTRHFKGIHVASEPHVQLSQLKEDVETMLRDLPSRTTDYWVEERFYVMLCVEKGDLINLFKPVCDQYHVPIVSSKGWAPILLRSHIANLSRKAEANGLTPVLLLFYDHDPAGLKISGTFRENLRDCEGGTGWSPNGLTIERFGLNAEDIERYGLMWIENLKTSSGRTSQDYRYIETYGNRKCEANALFKNDDTLKAGEQICRAAIEKYYGADASERFRRKEEASREKLKDVYANPVWKSVNESLDQIIEELGSTEKAEKPHKEIEVEKETVVFIDNKLYGLCPKCSTQFNYTEKDYGKQKRCRGCYLLMRLQFKEAEKNE